MSTGETIITIVGNITRDPELRHTGNGMAVANFAIASTPRRFDKQANDWTDGESLFLDCSVWREAAENAAQTLRRGMRVIATGRLNQRTYENRDGVKRTAYELSIEDIGPSLKNATATVTKTSRNGGGTSAGSNSGSGYGGYTGPQQTDTYAQTPDPWTTH